MTRFALAASCLVACATCMLACSENAAPGSEPPPVAPPVTSCAEGFLPGGAPARCAPILPAEDCPAGTMARIGSATCEPIGWSASACPSGFEPDPTGWGCVEVLPPGACDPGSMALLGETTCRPVGWTECPSGFEPDASGWGCHEVLPAAPCTGATRAALGSTTCVPIGACDAAFPPAGAAIFVDDSFTAAELDATHVLTLAEAVAAASPGDVVAVESGTYAEPPEIAKDLVLVGRCASEVIVEATTPGDPGVVAVAGAVVRVSGLGLRGLRPAAVAIEAATLHVEDCLIEDSIDLGVFSADDDTRLTVERSAIRSTRPGPGETFAAGADVEGRAALELTDCEIRDNSTAGVFVFDNGSTAVLTRSVVVDSQAVGGQYGHGVHLERGEATLVDSAILGNRVLGVYATGSTAKLALTGSVVRGTLPSNAGFGIGIQGDTGAEITLTRSALVANTFIGLFLLDAGTRADLVSSVIRGTLPDEDDEHGRGISAQLGPVVTVTDSAIVDNRQYGLVVGGSPETRAEVDGSLVQGTTRSAGGSLGWGVSVEAGGSLVVRHSAIESNVEYGISVGNAGSTATVESTLVRGTERSEHEVGDAWRVQGIGVQEGAHLDLRDSALLDNRHIGLYVWGADEASIPCSVDASGLVVRGTLPDEDTLDGSGAGVVVGPGATVSLTSAALTDNSTVGLLVTQPTALVTAAGIAVARTLPTAGGAYGRAISVDTGGELTLASAALVDNREIAFFLSDGARATASTTLVQNTFPDGLGETGRGVAVQFGSALTLRDSAVRGSRDIGVHVVGEAASAALDGTLVTRTAFQESDGAFGHGVLVHFLCRAAITRSVIAESSGIGLAFADAAGVVSSTVIEKNAIGLHAQDGSVLVATASVPAEPPPGEVHVADDCSIVDNVTRVGAGSIPLPDSKGVVP